MDHVYVYVFHRSTHKLDGLFCRGIWPKNIIVTQLSIVKVTTVSTLKSNPRIACKINHSSREAIVTAAEEATVRDLVAPWGLGSWEFQTWDHPANPTSYTQDLYDLGGGLEWA